MASDNKVKLLNDLETWQAFGIADDVFWRDEFKVHIESIKQKNPDFTKEQVIEQLEKELK